jgi:hypothetical protein
MMLKQRMSLSNTAISRFPPSHRAPPHLSLTSAGVYGIHPEPRSAEPRNAGLPEPHEAPVPLLPIESCFACEASGVTVKRMKRHWATVHGDVVADASQWRPVDLQTFFRGTPPADVGRSRERYDGRVPGEREDRCPSHQLHNNDQVWQP